jgi:hypothetical protein
MERHALALVVSTLIASVAFTVVKLSRPTTIDVRGSAKRRITSDLAEWSASVTTTRKERVEAYTALKKDVEVLVSFLEQKDVLTTVRVRFEVKN